MIRDDIADLRRYLVELRVLLFDQGAPGGDGGGGKVIGSPAPWNDVVGELLTDVHAGARSLARQWSTIAGRPLPSFGAVDAGTMRALDFVGTCVERVRSWGPFEEGMQGAINIDATEDEVRGWAVRARRELGIARTGDEPWTRVPGGLSCPNEGCGAHLYLAPGWPGEESPPVHCLSCRDSSGAPVRWALSEWLALVA